MSTTKVFKSINEIYPIIGDGLYQAISILIVCLAMLPVAMQQYIMIFLALPPPWKQWNSTKIHYPREQGYNDKCYGDNKMWTWNVKKQFSIITEFDLHCERESLVHTTTMLYFVFTMLGSFFWGFISDRFGRQKALFYGSACNICCALLNAYSLNLPMFMIIRAVNGFFSASLMMVMVVYGAEIVSENKRTIGGMFVWVFYSLGALLMALISHYTQNWRHLLIFCSAPFFIVVFLLRFLPESIAWEFHKGRCKDVQRKLKIIKIVNRQKDNEKELLTKIETTSHSKSGALANFFLLWTPWTMALKTTCLALSWIFLSIGYIGMSYVAVNITGNTYRDFALLNGSEIISCALAIYGSSRFGRKKTIIFAMIVGGSCLITVASIPQYSNKPAFRWIRLAFGVLGKLLATVVSDVIYSWTAETYPTFLRSTASGFHQASSYIGMTLAPWIALWLDRYHSSLPYYTMGGLLIFSSVLLFRIHETGGEVLSEQLSTEKEKDIVENDLEHNGKENAQYLLPK